MATFSIALTRSLAVRWTIERCWGHVDLFSSGYNNVKINWSQGCLKPLHLPHLWHVICGGLKQSYVMGLLLWLQDQNALAMNPCAHIFMHTDEICWESDCRVSPLTAIVTIDSILWKPFLLHVNYIYLTNYGTNHKSLSLLQSIVLYSQLLLVTFAMAEAVSGYPDSGSQSPIHFLYRQFYTSHIRSAL